MTELLIEKADRVVENIRMALELLPDNGDFVDERAALQHTLEAAQAYRQSLADLIAVWAHSMLGGANGGQRQ